MTSRAALHLWRWEHEFAVAPLPLPDVRHPQTPQTLEKVPSVALFVERARARRPGFSLGADNASAVAEVCVRLDGLPLAIELAAAGIKLLSPQAILTRLQRRLDLLGQAGGDFPSRHHTLREAVAWSYDLLSPRERALLRRLAVFVGSFSLEAAEAICLGDRIESVDILQLVARLVDQSLVVVEERGQETRYRLLETIREYAGDRLGASGEEELYRRRHAEWCVRLGLQAEAGLRGPQQSTWLDRLEIDHDNLRAALAWLAGCNERRLGLQLAAALWQFWWLRGYLGEGRRQLENLLMQREALPRSADTAKAFLAAGTLAFRQGDYASAESHLGDSLTIAREASDWTAVAAALRTLGRMAIDRGELTAARSHLEESLHIEREQHGGLGTAWALNYLGLLAHFEGDDATARSLLDESLPMLRALDDHWGTAVSLYYLGRVAFDRGEFSESHEYWTDSLGLCRARGYLWCVPYLLEGFACLAVVHNRPLESMRLAGAAEALHQSIGAPLPPVWAADLDRRLAPARRAVTESALSAAWFEGKTLSLEQACEAAASAAALAQPSGRHDAPHPLNPLTRREREVAALVARGLTNRQIGEQLVITEGTARIHVEHILDKLSLGSRTQLAGWVRDQNSPTRN